MGQVPPRLEKTNRDRELKLSPQDYDDLEFTASDWFALVVIVVAIGFVLAAFTLQGCSQKPELQDQIVWDCPYSAIPPDIFDPLPVPDEGPGGDYDGPTVEDRQHVLEQLGEAIRRSKCADTCAPCDKCLAL